uniref:Methylenetetrahydrofolate reductase n=1 Tax=Rhabditophanes sp. KR3021 TaxID=114890 RepID=A0AC35TKL0_9BILA
MSPNLEKVEKNAVNQKEVKEVTFQIGNAEYSPTLSRNASEYNLEIDERNLTPYVPLHKRINNQIELGNPFFSLEFFPPKTDRFRDGGPMFVDITWHLGSDPANLEKETSSSSIAQSCLDYCRLDTMLHMTCAQYDKQQTLDHLKQCKKMGLRNILALKGDIAESDDSLPEAEKVKAKYYALDMIKWIKKEYGDYFTVACSGYPLAHPDAKSYTADLEYLKAKVDAGADFIITQLFFEVATFEKFVRDCREIGIKCPILPGIMPIQGYASIKRIAYLSKLEIPQNIVDDLEALKHDDEAVLKYGIHRAVEMCRKLLNDKTAPSLHMYTMNRESAIREILVQLGLWKQYAIKLLPWVPHGAHHPNRFAESCRPIYWSARPKSYIFRTRAWDTYPNGRWSHSSSPSYREIDLFYLKGHQSKDKQLKMYGYQLESAKDVSNVFVRFLTQELNENGVQVNQLPWNENEGKISHETQFIKKDLLWCNQNGILTINSQPQVNQAQSEDVIVGWGQAGGYCYQKAYLEFFVSKEVALKLQNLIESSYAKRINYQIINNTGSIDYNNYNGTNPNVLTWGVFPGSEIAQPTVVDPLSFRAWKDEAFDVFNTWATIYPADSVSRKTLQTIHDEYCLVTLVDNDYVKQTVIYKLLQKVINS